MSDTIKDTNLGGGLKELTRLFAPVLLISFTNFLFLLVEKLYLARLSSDAMSAAVTVSYICQVFQIPCNAIALMTQVYVGQLIGRGKEDKVGSVVWQMIWFSCLSMLITLPAGLIYGYFYFYGTALDQIVWPYFYITLSINFLFPLGTALSCFFIAIKKTYFLCWISMLSQGLKIILGYLMIFGWKTWIPSFGLIGGALSLLIAQGSLCLILLSAFLSKHSAKLYGSHCFQLKWKLFWNSFYPGVLRALNRILNITSWVTITHLMTKKGGDYTLALSIGGTLFLFLPFISDSLLQVMVATISKMIGAKRFDLITPTIRRGIYLTTIAVAVVGIPMLFFPHHTHAFLFSGTTISSSTVFKVYWGVWISFAFFTFSIMPLSVVLAFKDTSFSFVMGGFNWINGYLFMYIAIEKFQITADQFWLVSSLMHASTLLIYYFRMRWLQKRAKKQGSLQLQTT